MDKRKPLPWPVLFAMYRAAVSPRIFVLEQGKMTIDVGPKCVLLPAHGGGPTIQVEGNGMLVLNLTDATIPLGQTRELEREPG